jgi:hypothetical protein
MKINDCNYLHRTLAESFASAIEYRGSPAPDTSFQEPAVIFTGSRFLFEEANSGTVVFGGADLTDLLKGYSLARVVKECDTWAVATKLANNHLQEAVMRKDQPTPENRDRLIYDPRRTQSQIPESRDDLRTNPGLQALWRDGRRAEAGFGRVQRRPVPLPLHLRRAGAGRYRSGRLA